MECVIAWLGSAVSSFSEHLCGLICSKVGNPFTFKSKYTHLKRARQRLNDLKSRVERDHDESVPGVNDWSSDVAQTDWKVETMQAKIEANKERCCGGFKNLFLQSREVAEALKEVRGLEVRGNCLANLLAASRQARAVELIPVESIDHQPAASKNLATILNHLNDDAVRTIGVWGQGGIGKTTLVKNLNNKLKDASSTTPFSIIIWITVSMEWDLKSIQAQIAQRLEMKEKTNESPDSLAARICERLKREVKFLLLLDDVWKEIDLDALGIPRPEDHAACKIILTTRFLDVCRGMKTDKEVVIHVLNDDEAWKLFCKSAGEEANLEDVEPVARAITKECGGLPLAINVMGTSMRKKTDKRLWMNALKELQKSAPHNIPGVEDKVYKSLKWSYDSLQGNNIRSCFLFCSLYPEDFSIAINKLVQCWLAEGLLDVDEQQSYEDIYNSGVALVENLKDCCLLEKGDDDERSSTVKMHDVVRDVAIWIASSSEDECKSLVQSGIGLSKFPESRLTPSLKRISFMRNALTWLPDSQIPCSEASTLLLQNNNKLEIVPKAFLLGFQALRVLNLSYTNIRRLPLSLIHLGELRALLLSHCRSLNELPPVGRLRKLQVLDCSNSGILKLPEGMEQLSNLRELNLSGTTKLKTYRAGLVSRLSGLEILDMSESNCRWCLKTERNKGNAALVQELGCLERLIVLMVNVNGSTHPFLEYAPWMERLKSFRIRVFGVCGLSHLSEYHQFVLRMNEEILFKNGFKNKDGKFEERRLLLLGLDLSGKWNEWLLLTRAAVLELEWCTGLNNLFDSVGGFVYLKSLTISFFNDRFKPRGGCRSPNDLLPNLEELNLMNLHSIESISELVGSLGLKFSRLKVMMVFLCSKLKYLFSCDDFTQPLEKLELIYLADWSDCSDLSDLFIYSSGQTSMSYPVAPNLREIRLTGLPKLKTLSRQEETWQHLEYIDVKECKNLKKLPLNEQSANTLKEIRGEEEWWKQLEWDDDVTSSTLQPLFKVRDF